MPDKILLQKNPEWINPKTRPGCKYSPVVVDKDQTGPAVESMVQVLKNRIAYCQDLATNSRDLFGANWFSFLRAGPSHEPHLNPSKVPVIVLSGGAAKKLRLELDKGYTLAWHPMNVRNEPVYLFVHKLEFMTYATELDSAMGQYKNLHLIGWDGGGLTGFGAARAAALAFADSLPYRPQRIVMMDQDVVQSTTARLGSPLVNATLEKAHKELDKPIIGYGVGYPTRVPEKAEKPEDMDLGKVKKEMLKGVDTNLPKKPDFNSPAQQFVSIQSPFRRKTDGAYPSYMVSGGEDMLMGLLLKLDEDAPPLIPAKIIKKDLSGKPDEKNVHWNGLRLDMLNALYAKEKSTEVSWDGKDTTIEGLVADFIGQKLIPEGERSLTSSLIVERIILRLHKLGKFPIDVDQTIFNKYQKPKTT